MTNEIRTRTIIVTLPDTSGEEADTACGLIEDALHDSIYSDRSARGMSADHALDEAPLITRSGAHLAAWPFDIDDRDDTSTITLGIPDGDTGVQIIAYLAPDDARKLAALLLRAANDAEAANTSPNGA